MIHSLHKARGTVLYDECESCTELASSLEVDDEALAWLADMAATVKANPFDTETHDLSMNERRAISRLRHMGRIVFKSGITEEVAR